ncbi:hypothetical protein HPB50_003400 [Hyalomma asiaticum]|uniref:Uncharacterized protein n=1 Tax=Hyalomma asiaticum TaxID=266040 RepID=A0ACB7RV35_HYAAI|nr:hypothetical protein HPB50_003400 [Hyalomma asiaticum]
MKESQTLCFAYCPPGTADHVDWQGNLTEDSWRADDASNIALPPPVKDRLSLNKYLFKASLRFLNSSSTIQQHLRQAGLRGCSEASADGTIFQPPVAPTNYESSTHSVDENYDSVDFSPEDATLEKLCTANDECPGPDNDLTEFIRTNSEKTLPHQTTSLLQALLSGTEEQYTTRDALLQEVLDLAREHGAKFWRRRTDAAQAPQSTLGSAAPCNSAVVVRDDAPKFEAARTGSSSGTGCGEVGETATELLEKMPHDDEEDIELAEKPNDDTPSASTNALQAAPLAPDVVDDGETAVLSAAAPSMEQRAGSPELELWITQRTWFLISKYKEWHPLVGKQGGFRQVSFTFPLKS